MQFDKRQIEILKNVTCDTDFYFSKHTTYGLGGKAKIAYFPKNEEEAVAVYNYLTLSRQKFVILGNGSNVLVSDSGYDGAVICTKFLKGVEKVGDYLYCLSGTNVSEFLNYCVKNGVGGYEYLSAIPASMGGIALMNGGIPDKTLGEQIVSVKIYDGKIRVLDNKNCNFGNKHSTMRNIKCLILGILLKCERENSELIKRKIEERFILRGGQPKEKSCGCVFVNPQGMSAGKLIDDAGLKGLTIGGATVSKAHANFITNRGGSAKDVYNLIKEVKRRVYDFCGVVLTEEVIYIGEFNETDS